jgi:hypothetical protein
MSKSSGIFDFFKIAAAALAGPAAPAVLTATQVASTVTQLASNTGSQPTPTATASGQLGGGNNLPVNYGVSREIST